MVFLRVFSGTRALFLALGVTLVGCAQGGGGGVGDDKGSPDEAGVDGSDPSRDGAVTETPDPDGAPPDSGMVLDTGMPDTGLTLDTGAPDTGSPEDAGAPDTGSAAEGGPPDTGAPDTGAADTGTPECTRDPDCDDGLGCNGVERCVAGSCVAGSPMACNDGVDCTVDRCEEPGRCVAAPSDAACGGGELCDSIAGCVSGCPDSPCRLVGPQCGCAGGQACYLAGLAGRVCALAGTGSEGSACNSPADCASGNQCISLSATGDVSVCARFCNTDGDCRGVGSTCTVTLSDGAGGTLAAKLCTRACDPIQQTGCPADAACLVYSEESTWMTDCVAPAGDGAQGDACTDSRDCQAGFACLDPDGTGAEPRQCLHWCEVVTGNGCQGSESCFGFINPARVGSTVYGVCF